MAVPVSKTTKPLAGWWSLKNLEGSRDGVTQAIADSRDVPEHWKTCLTATIASIPEEFNAVRLDAHCTEHDGLMNLNLTLRRRKVL